MSQPIAYAPAYNFTSYQAANPSTPLPADKLDTELNALKITTDSVRVNMALLQADDGTLRVLVVTPQSLSAATLALLTSVGIPRGAWLTATAYVAKDVVTQGSGTYICVTAHTSGTFATDLAAVKWILLAGSAGTAALSSLSDVNISAIADDQLLTYDSGTSKWINTLLTDDMVTAGTLSFASHATAFSVTSTALAGASNTNVPTTTAVKTYVDNQISRGTASPIASATTTSLTGNTFDFAHVTGTTTITGITLATDEMCWVVFDGILTLTYNGVQLILPGAANIVTAAGDRALFRGIDGTNVECLAYVRANGQALAGSSGRVVLNAQAISSSTASVSVTLPAGYTHYVWEISNLTPASSAVDAYVTVKQGGAYVAGTAYNSDGFLSSGGSVSNIRDNGAAKFVVTGAYGGISTTYPSTVVFECWNPASALGLVVAFETIQAQNTTSGYTKGGGQVNVAAATTDLKMILNGVNIATCTAVLYGDV